MKNPIILLIRAIALHFHRSKDAHKMLPLKSIKRAVVLINPTQEPDLATLEAQIESFFRQVSIPLTLLRTDRSSLNIAGFLKRKIRKVNSLSRGELFISLIADTANFASEYESRCTGAEFRIGCSDLGEETFDLYLRVPEGATVSQSQIFAQIQQLITKII